MWVSAIPELVGRLLVQVLCPGLLDLASKKVHDAQSVCKVDVQEIFTFIVAFGEAMRSKGSTKFGGV